MNRIEDISMYQESIDYVGNLLALGLSEEELLKEISTTLVSVIEKATDDGKFKYEVTTKEEVATLDISIEPLANK